MIRLNTIELIPKRTTCFYILLNVNLTNVKTNQVIPTPNINPDNIRYPKFKNGQLYFVAEDKFRIPQIFSVTKNKIEQKNRRSCKLEFKK